MRWAWGVVGAAAGLLVTSALLPGSLLPLAADTASVDGAGNEQAVPGDLCPDAPAPVELSARTLSGLRQGQPQTVNVALALDDLGQLAHAEGSVVDAKLVVDPALQQAFQAELDLRVRAVLLVAELPDERVQGAPVINATATVTPAAAGAATAGTTVRLYAAMNLQVRSVDEVCRAARSADVAAIAANTTPESFGR
ncbi:MAG: hypothetical protein AB7H93_25275 [Vicinamibacterales bacterium]